MCLGLGAAVEQRGLKVVVGYGVRGGQQQDELISRVLPCAYEGNGSDRGVISAEPVLSVCEAESLKYFIYKSVVRIVYRHPQLADDSHGENCRNIIRNSEKFLFAFAHALYGERKQRRDRYLIAGLYRRVDNAVFKTRVKKGVLEQSDVILNSVERGWVQSIPCGKAVPHENDEWIEHHHYHKKHDRGNEQDYHCLVAEIFFHSSSFLSRLGKG